MMHEVPTRVNLNAQQAHTRPLGTDRGTDRGKVFTNNSSKVTLGRTHLLHAALPVAVIVGFWRRGLARRGASRAGTPGWARGASRGAGIPRGRPITLVCCGRLPAQTALL